MLEISKRKASAGENTRVELEVSIDGDTITIAGGSVQIAGQAYTVTEKSWTKPGDQALPFAVIGYIRKSKSSGLVSLEFQATPFQLNKTDYNYLFQVVRVEQLAGGDLENYGVGKVWHVTT